MKPPIYIRLSFGDLAVLCGLIRCTFRHHQHSTRRSCWAIEWSLFKIRVTGGDPAWEPWTIGDHTELRRLNAWTAAGEHGPAPTPWRHRRPFDRQAAAKSRVLTRRACAVEWHRRMLSLGTALFTGSAGTLGGIFMTNGAPLAGWMVVVGAACVGSALLDWTRRKV